MVEIKEKKKDILHFLLLRYMYNIVPHKKYKKFYKEATIGRLYINGKSFCYTLEDVVRGDDIKIYANTAITQGHHEMILSKSNKFQRVTPEILDISMFTGIRLHGGNTPSDTLGCILAAYQLINKFTIYKSAEKDIVKIMEKAKEENKRTYITIVNT